jgi:hypothetical protein
MGRPPSIPAEKKTPRGIQSGEFITEFSPARCQTYALRFTSSSALDDPASLGFLRQQRTLTAGSASRWAGCGKAGRRRRGGSPAAVNTARVRAWEKIVARHQKMAGVRIAGKVLDDVICADATAPCLFRQGRHGT